MREPGAPEVWLLTWKMPAGSTEWPIASQVDHVVLYHCVLITLVALVLLLWPAI
jgi:hypothetical protein